MCKIQSQLVPKRYAQIEKRIVSVLIRLNSICCFIDIFLFNGDIETEVPLLNFFAGFLLKLMLLFSCASQEPGTRMHVASPSSLPTSWLGVSSTKKEELRRHWSETVTAGRGGWFP